MSFFFQETLYTEQLQLANVPSPASGSLLLSILEGDQGLGAGNISEAAG